MTRFGVSYMKVSEYITSRRHVIDKLNSFKSTIWMYYVHQIVLLSERAYEVHEIIRNDMLTRSI